MGVGALHRMWSRVPHWYEGMSELRQAQGEFVSRCGGACRAILAGMRRSIVGFRKDEHDDWVADLDCGHGQHVRHRPPFVVRPWVENAAGREARLGTRLDCLRCDRMEWPDNLVAYARTKEFDQDTVPGGLVSSHTTKAGVWARIHVLEGAMLYRVGSPVHRDVRLVAPATVVVVPDVPHRVEPRGPVRFFVEFFQIKRD